MIKIAQMLCPERHCFMAVAFDSEQTSDERAQLNLGMETSRYMINEIRELKCALCGSENFHVEIGTTRFRTMTEAQPAILACQADQLATRAYLLKQQRRQV